QGHRSSSSGAGTRLIDMSGRAPFFDVLRRSDSLAKYIPAGINESLRLRQCHVDQGARRDVLWPPLHALARRVCACLVPHMRAPLAWQKAGEQ
ncbi:MAG: hypothetical protein ACI83P_002573, partial [Janthinobacterium sp.]